MCTDGGQFSFIVQCWLWGHKTSAAAVQEPKDWVVKWFGPICKARRRQRSKDGRNIFSGRALSSVGSLLAMIRELVHILFVQNLYDYWGETVSERKLKRKWNYWAQGNKSAKTTVATRYGLYCVEIGRWTPWFMDLHNGRVEGTTESTLWSAGIFALNYFHWIWRELWENLKRLECTFRNGLNWIIFDCD